MMHEALWKQGAFFNTKPISKSLSAAGLLNMGSLTSFGMTEERELFGAATGSLNISAFFCSAI